MNTFSANTTYTTCSLVDAEHIIEARIIDRTARTVKAEVSGQPVRTFRVSIDHTGAECFYPWGRYSMAPVISAK